jgi:histidine ammonia-lyase
MGTDSALITSQVVENAYVVLSIELVALCQAVDFLKVENQLSTKSKALYKKVRENFPVIKKDEEIWENLENLLASLKN